MLSFEDQLILDHLTNLGFKNVSIDNESVSISNFSTQVSQRSLNDEGAIIPYTNDHHYHNYVYADGLLPNLQSLEVRTVEGRIHEITLPRAVFDSIVKQDIGAFIETAKLTTNSEAAKHQHVILADGRIKFSLDYTRAVYDKKFLFALLDHIQPRVASMDDINSGNYVSDLGKLVSVLNPMLKEQAYHQLLQHTDQPHDLLKLRDELVPGPITELGGLTIKKSYFKSWLNKEARELQLLAQRVQKNLGLQDTNWVSGDIQLLNNPNQNPKFATALSTRQPLFMSMTNGNHAFALAFDFAQKTLYLANPGATYDAFAAEIAAAKEVSGCSEVVHVITERLARTPRLEIDDTCTADAAVMVYMMQDYFQAHQGLTAGCLNGQQLKTAEYVLSPPTHPSTSKDHRSASISGGGSSGSGGSAPVSNPESLKNIRDSNQTKPQDGWNKAMQWLQQRSNDSNPELILYRLENGLEKHVSIKEQILLDELYAKKLQAEEEEDLKPGTGFKKS